MVATSNFVKFGLIIVIVLLVAILGVLTGLIVLPDHELLTTTTLPTTTTVEETITTTTTTTTTTIPRFDVTFYLEDSETGKPIKGENVYFDDERKGSTSEIGSLTITNILQGWHTISLDDVNTMLKRDVNIQSGDDQIIKFDMPNPILVLGEVVPEEIFWCENRPCTRFDVTITVRNDGNLDAKDVVAIVSVYNLDSQDNPTGSPYSQKELVFVSIPRQSSRTEKIEDLDRSWWRKQRVFVVLLDTYEYSPTKDITKNISPDVNIAEKIVQDSIQYCSGHVMECIGKGIKTAGAFAKLLLVVL